jgi:ribonuclease P protein component
MPGGVKGGPARREGGERPLPGPFRLASSRYKRVFAQKRSVYGRTLVMWVTRGADAGRRAGVVVSKRTFRRAVDRNRAKRLLREAFRLSRHRLAPDVDVVLVARAGIAGKSCRDVVIDLEAACRRASVRLSDGVRGEGASGGAGA